MSKRNAGGEQSSTLLQVDTAPTAQLALGITGLQRSPVAAAHAAHAASSAAGRDIAVEGAGASSGNTAAGRLRGALLQGSSAGSRHSLALTGECLPIWQFCVSCTCPFIASQGRCGAHSASVPGLMHVYDIKGLLQNLLRHFKSMRGEAYSVRSLCRKAGRNTRQTKSDQATAPLTVHDSGSSIILLAGAWRSYFDEYAVSGWLALDQATRRRQQSWGATFSSIPDPDGQGWALSLGR